MLRRMRAGASVTQLTNLGSRSSACARLRVEYMNNPSGVDVPYAPRLTWVRADAPGLAPPCSRPVCTSWRLDIARLPRPPAVSLC